MRTADRSDYEDKRMSNGVVTFGLLRVFICGRLSDPEVVLKIRPGPTLFIPAGRQERRERLAGPTPGFN